MRKRNVLCVLISILMVLSSVPMGVFAATTETAEIAAEREIAETGDTYYGDFSYTVNNGEARILKYIGSATELTIPSQIEGYPVTSITNSAFLGCTSLTSVEIPESVTSIGYWAFRSCSNLISIEIPEGVTKIEQGLFEGCYNITSIELPESVTIIESMAFYDCNKLQSIKIPEGVTSIGALAFYECYKLESIELPDGITIIDWGLFAFCHSLKSIEIPSGVTSIADEAFKQCPRLKSINIPSSVKSIGDNAFEYCSSLESIEIPSGVTFIGESAFDHCSSLTSITIPANVTSIGNGAFKSCGNLESITIPEGVESIGDSAFDHCTSLTSITIPANVTSIGNSAFKSCWDLESVTISEGVESIGDCAFEGCDSLKSITIPSSVKSIGVRAFEDCPNYFTYVYFIGTQKEWEAISIGTGNDRLLKAKIHFQPEVEFAGSSITLYGDLGVNFYMEVPEEVLADEDATVIFTYGGTTERVPASSGEQTDYGYKYTCNIPAKDMLTEVTCKVVAYDGTQSDAFSYTVKEYAETILANPEVYGEKAVALVKSMLNYGAAAQEYLGYNTDNLANDSVYMTQEDKAVPEKDFSDLSYDLTQGKDVKYYGTALSLKSEVGIKHYFTLSEGVNPDDVTVTVDGTQAKLVKNGNLYMVLIPNVAVHKLYTKIDVAVGDTTISYCVMDYAKTAQEAGKQELLKIMYALDVFAQNAVAYKG